MKKILCFSILPERLPFFLLGLLLITACQKEQPGMMPDSSRTARVAAGTPAATQAVLTWNEAATIAVARMGSGPEALPPMPESIIYAMTQIAVHDALNHIHSRYATYTLHTNKVANASPVAAISTAAHDVLVAMLPPQKAYLDELLESMLAAIPDQAATKLAGITLGKQAAAAILANRLADGTATAQFAYVPGNNPGDYQFTPPFDGPPFNGFAGVPGWGQVKPFVLTSGSQFRPPAPYAINSPAYTADFNEVKILGKSNSPTRTTDQTQVALFWIENSPLGWNRIARQAAIQEGLDAWKNARLFALLQMAEADSYIAAFEAKYHYNYWRPITAIRLAATDGNDNTLADPSWELLAPPTPPVPDYPSAHASAGGAGATVLAYFFGRDNLSFSLTSTSLPGISRQYASFSQAADENAASRVYVGYHFRNAATKGVTQGEQVGAYVYTHSLN